MPAGLDLPGPQEPWPPFGGRELCPPSTGLIPDTTISTYGRLLAPEELFDTIAETCIDPEITNEIADDINHHRRRLFFYAFVKYFDCAEQLRELQFCYVFIPGDQNTGYGGNWALAGSKEYNKHT